ncbi:tyrosine-type recombinase/integrase [Bdellovibrio sp.]|uniref:tyrosine-type recombinase/integrase n=1 Tax=Bdellovibrio sp. TaxID=28201 RepID=UPI003221BF88
MTNLLPQVSMLSKEDRMRELVNLFLKGRKKTTLDAYQGDLEDFRMFVGSSSVDEAMNALLSLDHGNANFVAMSYRNHLFERSLSPATINRRLAALRSIVRLANLIGLVYFKIEVANEKVLLTKDVRGPDKDGIKAIFDSLSRRTDEKGIRDLAIVTLFYSNGLRSFELINIDMADLDLGHNRLKILGKGRSEKEWIDIPEITKSRIEAWIQIRGLDNGPLFINLDRSKRRPGRISLVGMYKIIERIGRNLGLKLRPHKLRHASVGEALKQAIQHGLRLDDVLKFSRHLSLQSLQAYLDAYGNPQGEISELISRTLKEK